MSAELKPCPFCGEPIDHMGDADVDEYFCKCSDGTLSVGCHQCGTNGPGSRGRDAAITAWNLRTDLSQASVAAALEAAADEIGDLGDSLTYIPALGQGLSARAYGIATKLTALITPDQRTALQAAIDAAKAEARAEDAAKIEALVDTVKHLNAACDAMWNDPERLEKNAGYLAGQQPWRLKDAHLRAISEAQQASLNALNHIGAKS